MRVFNKVREIFNNFKKTLVLFFDKKVPFIYKLIPIAAVGYILFPFDFISDFFPFLGQLDDFAVLTSSVGLFLKLAQRRNL